ncbi:MAG: HAMP domain-containing sensor histidine kinase [Beijerinckiaceae bacterium]
MARLYLKIYLAVLGSIALFAVLAAIAWRATSDIDRFGPRYEFVRTVAEQFAPAPFLPPDQQRAVLQRLRETSGFDLAIFDREGRLVAEASDGLFRQPMGWRGPMHGPPPHMGHWRRHRFTQVVPLSDGRTIVAARPPGERQVWRSLGPLSALAGIALAVGIAAYPLVRRLTRRLENLQQSVAALGQGDLAARVTVDGKDEVARLAETFNRTAERIQTLVTANRSLLANASHELRSPLARLRMGIEGLSSSPPSPEKTAELTRNIRELDQLIEEILLASRLDGAGAMAMAPERVDILALVAEECAAADAALDIKAAGLPAVSGDPRLLKRVVRNLIENAVRHGGGGRPDVALSGPENSRVIIDVADRGPGVPEAERMRIFEPFYRAKGASEAAGGVGLGLALVKQIAERHGGSAECLPRTGGGSVFRVSLPVA